MIHLIDYNFGPSFDESLARVRARTREHGREILERVAKPELPERPSDWLEKNVILKTPAQKKQPGQKAAWSFTGRECWREMVDAIAEDDWFEMTVCGPTGFGKTSVTGLAHLLWKIRFESTSAICVFPALRPGPGTAQNFVTGSMKPTLEVSRGFIMPSGAERNDITSIKIKMMGSDIDFTGSKSPRAVSDKRCDLIVLQEQDKFEEALRAGRESGTDAAAMQRLSGGDGGGKLTRSSTPTREDFGIWPNLMRSDLRRRFLSCPFCNSEGRYRDLLGRHSVSEGNLKGWFVLVKDKQFTVLPDKMADGTAIPLAELRWDKEAKRLSGEWDMDRVIRSARFECPHCGGHVRDGHRLWLDRNGVWIPTRAALRHRGYHINCYYGPHAANGTDFESSYGGMAKKFIDAGETGKMRDVINLDLAEVHVSQEASVGSITVNAEKIAGADWHTLMTCDFQKLWPFIWFLIQRWSSFKLLPPLPLTNGKPYFLEHFKQRPDLQALCEKVTAGHEPAWFPLAELLRFDTRTGSFPILEFCAAKNLTGENLVRAWRETAGMNTMDFGRFIFREMGQRMPKGGDSEIIAAGHCELSGDDAWEELREFQQQFEVGSTFTKMGISPNNAVSIDAGYAEEHNPEVLRKCFESGMNGRFEFYDPMAKRFTATRMHQFCRPVPVDGWLPFKGYPIAKRWRQGGIEKEWRFAPDDPFKGTSEAEKYTVAVLEAASDLYFHRWTDSRERQAEIQKSIKDGKVYRGNIWGLAADLKLFPANRFTRKQFDDQMNSRWRDSDGNILERGSGGGGKRRHPDHLNDCARNQYALAEAHGIFSYEPAVRADK